MSASWNSEVAGHISGVLIVSKSTKVQSGPRAASVLT